MERDTEPCRISQTTLTTLTLTMLMASTPARPATTTYKDEPERDACSAAGGAA